MKINKASFVKFLKKINLCDTEQINEAIFNFTDEGMIVSAKTSNRVVRVDSVLNSSCFLEYEAIGKIGIQDINALVKIVSKSAKEITLKVEGNLIYISDNKKEVSTELVSQQYINEPLEKKDIIFDENFIIDVSEINEAIDDAKVNSDFDLKFVTVENGLQIQSTGKYKFKRNFSIEGIKGGTTCKVGMPFVNAVSALTDKVEISITEKAPVRVTETTDDSVVCIMVAPLTK